MFRAEAVHTPLKHVSTTLPRPENHLKGKMCIITIERLRILKGAYWSHILADNHSNFISKSLDKWAIELIPGSLFPSQHSKKLAANISNSDVVKRQKGTAALFP